MKRVATLSIIVLAVLVAAPSVWADGHEKKGKKYERSVEGHRERAAEAREKGGDDARAAREASEERAEEAREAAEERGEEARAKGRDARQKSEAARDEGKGRGGEMRDRRDERKAIMAESKSDREPGTPQKGKKPWWKFWGSDEAEAATEEADSE